MQRNQGVGMGGNAADQPAKRKESISQPAKALAISDRGVVTISHYRLYVAYEA